MRYLFLLLLTGCAASGGPSASNGGNPSAAGSCVHDVARSWIIASIGETINLSQNCTGYTVLCGMQFTYTKPTATGQSTVTVISNNGNPGCTPPGTYSCTMNLYGYSHGQYGLMGLNCGAGEVVYDAD